MSIPSLQTLIILLFCLAILPSPVHALKPAQVFEKVRDSVVIVKTLDAQGEVEGFGSGILISYGKVVTNCHVVEGGVSYAVGHGNRFVSGNLSIERADKDVCILDAKGITGNPAALGKAADLKVGDPVYAVGVPHGQKIFFSKGTIAQLRGAPSPLIQSTAPISSGSSGGGLFDGEGRLVGLTTLYIKGRWDLNFAIPVEWISEIKTENKSVFSGMRRSKYEKRALLLEIMEYWQWLRDWCREWTESDPENYSAWYNLGIAYGNLKRHDDAICAFRQALRIDPDNAKAWYNLGIAYVCSCNRSAALDAVRELQRLDPERANKLYHIANPHWCNGRTGES